MICPCQDCQKRTAECHAKCRGYAEWKSEHEKMKAALAAEEYNPQSRYIDALTKKKLKRQYRSGYYGN